MSVEDELTELRKAVAYHLHRYHVLDAPEIADAEYDALFDSLLALEAEHPELLTPDSPSQRVGAPALSLFEKVGHEVAMLSLDKCTTAGELEDWITRGQGRLATDERLAFFCEPKIDGVAVALVYEDGLLSLASTRGDGRQPIERTVIEMRSGILDKIETQYLEGTRDFDIHQATNYGEKISIEELVPDYKKLLQTNCAFTNKEACDNKVKIIAKYYA